MYRSRLLAPRVSKRRRATPDSVMMGFWRWLIGFAPHRSSVRQALRSTSASSAGILDSHILRFQRRFRVLVEQRHRARPSSEDKLVVDAHAVFGGATVATIWGDRKLGAAKLVASIRNAGRRPLEKPRPRDGSNTELISAVGHELVLGNADALAVTPQSLDVSG